jgi:predicted dehydrogenase
MRPVRVALVGAGALGCVHARVLSEIPGAELVGVHDLDAARAADAARRARTRVLADLDAVAEAAEAAVVATPTRHHAAVATRLLERGVHCLVEKPLCSTVEEGRALVELAHRQGRILMVGHVERFNPAVRALLERDLRPRFFEAHRVSPYSFRSGDVSVVLDLMIHDIDIILHLVRSPLQSVHAVGVAVLGTTEDLASARLVFANGAVANVTASRMALKTERKLRLFAPDTYVTLDFKEKKGRILRPAPRIREELQAGRLLLAQLSPLEIMVKRLVREEVLRVDEGVEPLRSEDEEFVASVREGRAPAVPGEHGVLAMETAERVLRSIRENLESAQLG